MRAHRRRILALVLIGLATGCLDHANPFDPSTAVDLTIEGSTDVSVGEEIPVRLRWTPASPLEPEWSYDVPGVVIFRTFLDSSEPGTAEVMVLGVASGTVVITGGFGSNTTTHALVVQ